MLVIRATAAASTMALLVAAAPTPVPGGAPPTAAQCTNPSFSVPHGSPFAVSTKPNSRDVPRVLAAGNFRDRPPADRDCACDLAVAVNVGESTVPDGVVLMRGNPDGTFTPAPQGAIEVRDNPIALVSGRFNTKAPGLDSIVVVSTSGVAGTATILSPDPGTGVYSKPPAEPSEWATGEAPSAAGAGDFNGDGSLDAVIANRRSRSLTILVGNGAGSFARDTLTVKGLSGAPVALAAGEFTGGGPEDVAVVTIESPSGESSVVVVEGSASGTFTVQQRMPLGQTGGPEPLIAAAKLSRPSTANSPGVARDLVVAFADLGADGQPAARFKVLLGKDGGGFVSTTGSQDQPIGNRTPRSLAVGDLDGDRLQDVAIATFGDTGEGAIHLFRGSASDRIGFHPVPEWRPIPSNSRQDSLVSGRFGPKPLETSPAHGGLAAINVTTPRTVGVYLGNGSGAFVEPQIVTTGLDASPDLFVTADLHSDNGGSPLQDIAYVTRSASGSRLAVLFSSGGGGFSERVIGSAGANPQLIAAGSFVKRDGDKRPNDIAIVDLPPSGGPILKIFVNDGKSGLTPSGVERPLGAGGAPTAMVAGRFRGDNMPTDIALFRGRTLVMLVNNGDGRFTPATEPVDVLVDPGAVAASNNLRSGSQTDIVVKERGGNRVVFLVNIGEGRFRVADVNGGVFGPAGNVDDVLLGNVTSSALDDVVTYDNDMTVRVWGRLDTSEGFDVPQVSLVPKGITFGLQRYFLADFGDGRLGLAAAAIIEGKSGILTLHGNGAGVFTTGAPVSDFNPFDLRPAGEPQMANHFQQTTPATRTTVTTSFGAVGRFRNSHQGNSKPDLAFVTMVRQASFVSGLCPGIPPSQAPSPPFEEICPPGRACFPDEKPIPPGNLCFDDLGGPCCFCKFACPKQCNVTPDPMLPFCRTTRESRSISVFGNTCGE